MANIHAVLLVPAEGDPLNLLAEGPCGARPPMVVRAMWRGHDRKWSKWAPRHIHVSYGPGDIDEEQRALVLAWDGHPCNHAGPWMPPAMTCGWLGYLIDLLNVPDVDRENIDLTIAHFSRFGTLIPLDADGREVST